jgi:hypothetical protein
MKGIVPIPVEQTSNKRTFRLLSLVNSSLSNLSYNCQSLNKQKIVITMRMVAWVTASACKCLPLESHSKMFNYLHVSKIRGRCSRKLTVNAAMPSTIMNRRYKKSDCFLNVKIIESESSNMHRQSLFTVRQRN